MRKEIAVNHSRICCARLACPLLLTAALGCASSDPDLPAGWEGAQRIEHFEQHPCGDSALNAPAEMIDVEAAQDGIRVDYEHAHFRCEQDVEGYLRETGTKLDVLVQPIDMNPKAVAACDCTYAVAMTLPAKSGQHEVTVYRRWDNINDDNDPVKIGAEKIDTE
jgi:hypothetical protein